MKLVIPMKDRGYSFTIITSACWSLLFYIFSCPYQTLSFSFIVFVIIVSLSRFHYLIICQTEILITYLVHVAYKCVA